MRSHLVGRLAASAALLVGTVSAIGVGTALIAAAPAAADTGAYGGTASGNLVGASAVNIPGTLQVADASVAPATALVSSTAGLTTPPGTTIVPPSGKQSYARAANVDAQALNANVKLNNLVLEADQSAAPDNPTPVTKQLLKVPADPLLDAGVSTETASARWLGPNDCLPAGVPIAHGNSEVANANVITGTPAGAALVSVVNGTGGGPAYSDASVKLISVPGQTGLGVQGTQLDQLTGIVLFKGSANELTINVLAPPMVTAIATGSPGGASVTYTEPVLQVVQGGKVQGELNAKSGNTSITIPAIATLTLGKLVSKVDPAGLSASGAAELLSVAVGVAPLPLNVATITIAGASASAYAPSGGVNCPNPLQESHKDVSSSVVKAGQNFTYTISVPNRGACILDPVSVTDTVTAPAGTTVVSTDPAATKTDGLKLTWTNIGPIAPNQTVNIQITMQAPPTLATTDAFANDAVITGVCKGSPPGTPPWTQPVHVSGPTPFVPAASGCHLNGSNKSADHLQVMVNESFNYYIHVLNDGTADCTNVTITDTLPSTVTFVSATDGGTLAGGVVTWHLGTLPSGASKTVAVLVTVNPTDTAASSLADTALITSDQGSHSVTTNGPAVTGTSVLAPPNPASPTGGNGPNQPSNLPTTGGQPLAPYGLGLLAVGFALWGWRRRSRMA